MSADKIDYIRHITTPCCLEAMAVKLGHYATCDCCGRIFHLTWAGTIRMKHTNRPDDCRHHQATERV